jgi:hypothetical protein
MYRIDENTFIDESLVTCAEYQLFIDEMRAQGQFFRPDHWMSWQFPAGQAHTPILGVRPSDARAFCKWLSRREEGEWRFRLPTADEATQYPIQKRGKRLNGFWTLDGNEQPFSWVGPTPVDPRGINFPHIFVSAFDLYFASARARDLARTLGLALALDLSRTRALDLALDYACARDLALDLDLTIALDFSINRDIGKYIYINSALDRALDLAITRAIDHSRDHDLVLDLNFILSIWIDLITLQKRITGHSPAFEGIRLVKERKAA